MPKGLLAFLALFYDAFHEHHGKHRQGAQDDADELFFVTAKDNPVLDSRQIGQPGEIVDGNRGGREGRQRGKEPEAPIFVAAQQRESRAEREDADQNRCDKAQAHQDPVQAIRLRRLIPL